MSETSITILARFADPDETEKSLGNLRQSMAQSAAESGQPIRISTIRQEAESLHIQIHSGQDDGIIWLVGLLHELGSKKTTVSYSGDDDQKPRPANADDFPELPDDLDHLFLPQGRVRVKATLLKHEYGEDKYSFFTVMHMQTEDGEPFIYRGNSEKLTYVCSDAYEKHCEFTAAFEVGRYQGKLVSFAKNPTKIDIHPKGEAEAKAVAALPEQDFVSRWHDPIFQKSVAALIGLLQTHPVILAEADMAGVELGPESPLKKLKKPNLCQARLSDVDLSHARLASDWDDAQLDRVRFVGTTFADCSVRRARIADCDLSSAQLAVHLDDTVFERCNFAEAKFSAEGRYTDQGGRRARFVDCDFRGAVFKKIQFRATRFVNCRFDDASFVDCDFRGVKFEGGEPPRASQFSEMALIPETAIDDREPTVAVAEPKPEIVSEPAPIAAPQSVSKEIPRMSIDAFVAVCDASRDDASYLAALKTAFAGLPDGADLDFAPFEAFWREGAELPASHRQWLARRVHLVTETTSGYSDQTQVFDNQDKCLDLLYRQCPPEQWQSRRERWLTLAQALAPAHWLVGMRLRNDTALPQGLDFREIVTRNLHDARALLQAIAAGDPDWRGVAEKFAACGVDLNKTAALLTEVDDTHYGAADAGSITALLVLYRSGVEAFADDADWWRRLATVFFLTQFQIGAAVESDKRAECLVELYRPLLLAQLANPAALAPWTKQSHPMERLCDEYGFSRLCLTEPTWLDWLDSLGEDVLWNYLRDSPHVRDEKLVKAHPEAWLRLLKLLRKHDLSLPDELILTTPEAVAWYRQALPELARARYGGTTEPVLKMLVNLMPAKELTALVLEVLDSDSRLPYDVAYGLFKPDALAIVFEHPQAAWLREQFASVSETWIGEFVEEEDGEKREARADDAEIWRLLKLYSERYPDLFAEHSLSRYSLQADDPERVAQLWRDVVDPKLRHETLWTLLSGINESVKPVPWLTELAACAWSDNEAAFVEWLDSRDAYLRGSVKEVMAKLAESGQPQLLRAVPVLAAHELGQSSWFGRPDEMNPGPVRTALAAAPEAWDLLSEKSRQKLLPMLDDAAMIALGARLADYFATAKAKGLRDQAAEWLKQRSLAAIEKSGLLAADAKPAFMVVTQGLGLHPDPAVLPLLRERVTQKGLDAFVTGLLLDRLEAAGDDIAAYDPDSQRSLETLQAEAAKAKIPASIKKIWSDDFARVFEPLGEAVGQWCLALVAESRGDLLSRQARSVIERLPTARRADLAEIGTALWVDQNGAEAVVFLMALVPRYGDERVVNLLVKAVKAWAKTRKPKASAAIAWMAKTPGVFGAAQVHAFWESRKLSDSIHDNAWKALVATAASRGLEIDDFLDELVPDFGLGSDGLVLDVGPYSYRARLFPDFSLKIENEKGKLTASLPKAKAGEDPDKRGVAEQRLKALSKNLKPLLKQQTKKLVQALATGKQWPVARWQRLFMAHPLLSALARGLTWTALDGAGEPLRRFRPTESATLIDLDDEDVTLDGAVTVRLTHPVEVDEAERERWVAHFGDYDVNPTVPQWDMSGEVPSAEELEKFELARHQGFVLNRGVMGSLMEKWGYLKGPGEDGARINYHYWVADDLHTVTFHHSGINVWFEPDEDVAIESFSIRRRPARGAQYENARLIDLPIALQATLLSQSSALAARGEGFRANWRNL